MPYNNTSNIIYISSILSVTSITIFFYYNYMSYDKPCDDIIDIDFNSLNKENNLNHYFNKNDYPKGTWYINSVNNLCMNSSSIIPEFVRTHTIGSIAKEYTNDILYKVMTGRLNPDKKYMYLIHGRNGYITDLYYLGTYLSAVTDYNIILVHVPNSTTCTIKEGADILKYVIDRTYYINRNDINEIDNNDETNTESNIYLIGHSKGGLIAMYYNELMTSRKADKILTIASPINGTDTAFIALDYNTRNELIPNSKCLIDINNKLNDNSHTLYYHIAVEKDHAVPCIADAIPHGHHKDMCCVLTDTCHVSVVCSNKLLEYVNKWMLD